jgi:Flp pilus assembly protein protease CpaA
MVWLWLALVGLPVGLVLDRLTVRLLAPSAGDGDVQGSGAAAAVHAARSLDHKGSESPSHAWARRFLVVAVTKGLFAVAGLRFDRASHLAVVTAYISVLVLCAGTDMISFRVPNAVTYPAMVGAVLVGIAMPGANVGQVFAGGVLAGGILLLPALLTGGVGMGLGDAKLATFAGLTLGLPNAVSALLVMALLGGASAALLLVTRTRRRDEAFISADALIALLWRGPAFVQL